MATVAASRSGGAISPRLHAALFGRVAAALGGWLGQPALELGLALGDGRSLSRDKTGVVQAELPFAWLGEV